MALVMVSRTRFLHQHRNIPTRLKIILKRRFEPFPLAKMAIYNADEDTILDEAGVSAHIEASMDPGAAKTPVSLLQELYVKKGINPKYDLIQIEGAIHEPTFKYRVSVGDLVAVGSGQSKKKAKHAAAKAVLDKIWGGQSVAALMETLGSGLMPTVTSPYDDGIPGNPVGSLQEICISHRWAPPSYLLEGENGLPHEREFVITCIVESYHEVGVGKSKKLAKRQAAYRMLMKLKDTPIELPNQGGGLEDEDEIAQRASLRCGFKDNPSKNSHGMKITQFHRSLRKITGEKIAALQEAVLLAPNEECIQLLNEIATEQKFDTTYVDIEEKTQSGKYQCLVTMSLTPIAVSYGSGSSYQEAQKQAALNALYYLRLMTKRPPTSNNEDHGATTDGVVPPPTSSE